MDGIIIMPLILIVKSLLEYVPRVILERENLWVIGQIDDTFLGIVFLFSNLNLFNTIHCNRNLDTKYNYYINPLFTHKSLGDSDQSLFNWTSHFDTLVYWLLTLVY